MKKHYNVVKDISRRGEPVLHGFTHETTAYTNEFTKLNRNNIQQRILYGKRILQQVSGKKILGFVPPKWILSRDLLSILKEEQFLYTTTFLRIIPFDCDEIISPVVNFLYSYNPVNNLLAQFALLYARYLVAKKSLIRIAIHPQGFKTRKSLVENVLKKIINEQWIRASAVFGIFPANSTEDDIEVYQDESCEKILTVIHSLRQQSNEDINLALADFIAPKDLLKCDYIGGFAVNAGDGVDQCVKRFQKNNDDYSAIMIKALADRLVEALAETLHERIRKEFWGYAANENLSNEELIAEKYIGIRPAIGYPAYPDHTEKQILFDLLNVNKNISIELTENYAMKPAAAVSGLYFSHSQSKYFRVGNINKDQVTDYALRKKMDVSEIEKWLSANLGYSID